jgi:ABC-type lipoprotein release transport system permease subunit
MALGRDEDKSWGLIVKRGMTLTVIGVSALLFAVALAACLIPARRAASIEPTQALRAE